MWCKKAFFFCLILLSCKTIDTLSTSVISSDRDEGIPPLSVCAVGQEMLPFMFSKPSFQPNPSIIKYGNNIDYGIGTPGGYPRNRQIRLEVCFTEDQKEVFLEGVTYTESDFGMSSVFTVRPVQAVKMVGLEKAVFGDYSILEILIKKDDYFIQIKGWNDNLHGFATFATGAIDTEKGFIPDSRSLTGGLIVPGSPWVGDNGCSFGFYPLKKDLNIGDISFSFQACVMPSILASEYFFTKIILEDQHPSINPALKTITLDKELLEKNVTIKISQHNWHDLVNIETDNGLYQFDNTDLTVDYKSGESIKLKIPGQHFLLSNSN